MKRSRPKQHKRRLKSGKVITINKGIRKRSLFHGTSEEALAKMATQGGLKPQQGNLWLSDDPQYARFIARQSVKDTTFSPVVIEVDEPEDAQRVGRHFVSKKNITVRNFRKIYAGNLKNIKKDVKNNYGSFLNKNNDEYLELSDPEYKAKVALKDSKMTYGKVSSISGKKVGKAVTASGVVVPVILPLPIMAAAGAGISKGIDSIKLIHTDEHDNPYKIPKIEIHRKKRK